MPSLLPLVTTYMTGRRTEWMGMDPICVRPFVLVEFRHTAKNGAVTSPHLLVVGGSRQILLSLGRSPPLGLLPLGGVAVSVVEGLRVVAVVFNKGWEIGSIECQMGVAEREREVYACGDEVLRGVLSEARSSYSYAILAALEPRRQTSSPLTHARRAAARTKIFAAFSLSPKDGAVSLVCVTVPTARTLADELCPPVFQGRVG